MAVISRGRGVRKDWRAAFATRIAYVAAEGARHGAPSGSSSPTPMGRIRIVAQSPQPMCRWPGRLTD
jgi:hypothetical protein